MWHRRPVVAGAFYPSSPVELTSMIDSYIKDADTPAVDGKIYGVISPHAGYVFSGPVAGYAYRLVQDLDVDVAVVLAPSHRARFQGASVIPEGTYSTPLGDVPVMADIGRALVDKPRFTFVKEAHEAEHSLEVQVPFLQRVLGDFSIVPIVVGTTDLDICTELAEEIYEVLKDRSESILVVVSTDLSHYHSYNEAKKLDAEFTRAVSDFDVHEVNRICTSGKAEACGEGPVITGMSLCKKLGASKSVMLQYANSGDTAGSKDQVVGYFAAAMTG